MDFSIIVTRRDRTSGRELESTKRNSLEITEQKKIPRRGNILILSLLKVEVGVWLVKQYHLFVRDYLQGRVAGVIQEGSRDQHGNREPGSCCLQVLHLELLRVSKSLERCLVQREGVRKRMFHLKGKKSLNKFSCW